jgi:hypothetical protein
MIPLTPHPYMLTPSPCLLPVFLSPCRQSSFDALFAHLIPHLPYLFPSSHVPPSFGPQLYVPKNPGGIDALDMPIWQMLGSLALHCGMQQQQALVGEMRDKILEGVVAAKQGWGTSSLASFPSFSRS